jgi:ribosomal protein L7/L12
MRKVVKHDGRVIDSLSQLPNGDYVKVSVYTIYDVEDLPTECYIGGETFSRTTFMAMVYGLLNASKKVQAIKIVKRCGTDWGLREAKEFVDNLIY